MVFINTIRDAVAQLYQQIDIVAAVGGSTGGSDTTNKLIVMTTAAAAAAAALLLTYYATTKRNSVDDPTPLVPYRWPIIGSTLDYFADPDKFTKEKTIQYGPVFRVHLLGQFVTVVGGNLAHEVFMNPNLNFVESSQRFFDIPLFLQHLHNALPDHALRDIISKDMTQRLSTYSGHFEKQVLEEYKSAIAAAKVLGDLKEPKIISHVNELARAFVARTTAYTMAGTAITENKELMHMFEHIADDCMAEILFPSPVRAMLPWWNDFYKRVFYPRNAFMKKSIQKVREGIKDEVFRRLNDIQQGKEQDEDHDVLGYILKEYLTNVEEKVDQETVLDTITIWFVLMTFLGVMTTSGTLIGVLYQLAKTPAEYISELREEQQQQVGGGASYCYKRMEKLDSFIRESFRYNMKDLAHPHLNVSKENVVFSNGTIIRPGEEVYTNFWHVNFDETVQNDLEDPFEFKPFRFVGRGKQSTKCSADYLIFGLGRHACPGRWFAIEEIKAILTVIIRNYDLSLVPPADEDKSNKAEKKKNNNRPAIQFINRESK